MNSVGTIHPMCVPLYADFSGFDHLRETIPYRKQPKAMPAGAVGKRGTLYLSFERTDDGREMLRRLQRRAPIIVQQALYFDESWPELPCVYILSSGGPYVDGDRYEQHIHVGREASAFVSTGAATKIASMRANYAALLQRFTLDTRSYLEFLPEPTIPCRHSRFVSQTELVVDATATLCFAETFLGGRKHFYQEEHFAYDLLSIATTGKRPDGQLLFHDKCLITPEICSPKVPGVMRDYEVFAHVMVLTPEADSERIYARTEAEINRSEEIATAISRLPHRCGLIYKVMGTESEPVKRRVRQFVSTVRSVVKGRTLPKEFPWR